MPQRVQPLFLLHAPSGPMQLTLHRSNHVEELGRAFMTLLRERPLADPFQAETVLVGSTGLRDWLRRRVAQELGIAAQLSFVYPGTLSSWLHQAHRRREEGDSAYDVRRAADAEEETPWVPDRLVWVVASELLAWRARAESAPQAPGDRLSTYLLEVRTRGDAPGTLSAPLFALATEVSRLFLRYHAWRPGMIAAWARGENRYTRRDGTFAPFDVRAADLAWQPDLWRRVRERLARGGATDPLAELGVLGADARNADQLTAASLAPDPALTDALRAVLPPRLSLFGVGSLAPLQLLALGRIAETVPVHWFLTAPTPFWLGDQTLRGVESQDLRRRALLGGGPTAEQRRIYLDDPQTRAERTDADHDSPGESALPDPDADLEVAVPYRSFDDLEGTVCPLVAAFGRVPRAGQLLLEQVMPNAQEGDTSFVHPLVAEAERRGVLAEASAGGVAGESSSAAGRADALADVPSLLHRLQADVYMLEADAYAAGGVAGTPFRQDIDGGEALVSRRGERGVAATDRSLGFHACYGPSRQVDAVRDLIVDALARDASLRPGDIAVMTPDIAKYAPLIEATFLPHAPRSESRKRTGIPGVPIRIQDRAIRSTNPVAGVLLALLGLAEGRRTMSAVVGLLGLEPVHTHFGLERDDVTRIEMWLRGAGARWGVDAEDLRREEQPTGGAPKGSDSRLRHTLLAALERLSLGAVMPLKVVAGRDGATLAGVERAGALPVFPLDEAGDGELAAKAVLFLETLIGALEELRAPRSMRSWLALFADESAERPGLLQRFVTLPASRAWQKAQVMDELEALGRDAGALGLGEGPGEAVQVTPAAMAAWMRSRMDRADRRVSDGLDAVTFCSLMPVRSVPYRWIILLGMDQDVFPRVGTRPAWDLIAREQRPWDRNPRDEDRALFLDALLSAREACHIVFTGRSPQRNEAVAPTAPVAQLMEMLDRRFESPPPVRGKAGPVSAWLTRHYPLQPFSERNFREEAEERDGHRAPRPPVYHRGEWRAARSLLDGRGSGSPWALQVPWHASPVLPEAMRAGTPVSLSLRALGAFHDDPLGGWLEGVAGLKWPKKDEEAPDDLLPVASGVLDRLDVMKRASRHAMVWDDALTSAFAKLPIGGPGRAEGRELLEKVARLQSALHGPVGLFAASGTRRAEVLLEVGVPGGEAGPVSVRLHGDVQVAPWREGGGAVVLSTQFSSVKAKHALGAWLELLLVLAAEDEAGGAGTPLDGVVLGVASHRPDGDIGVHGAPLAAMGCPGDRLGARRWARARLEERVRVWLVGHARPLPVLPSGGADTVGKGYGKFVARAGDTGLRDWLAAYAHVLPVWAPLPGPGGADSGEVWGRALERLRDAHGDGFALAVLAMRKEARGTWNPEKYLSDAQRFREDTEQSLLQRVFAQEGPAQRWPEAFLVDSWQVFGPGVALAEAMKDNALTTGERFADWKRGGVA
ncbi:MAG: exonuclease V subunit gamma [Deltaproteobacteria bacterium]|nr:MAG: exonuclease V subunit gamma [Deltaproteobacteria bacterium]